MFKKTTSVMRLVGNSGTVGVMRRSMPKPSRARKYFPTHSVFAQLPKVTPPENTELSQLIIDSNTAQERVFPEAYANSLDVLKEKPKQTALTIVNQKPFKGRRGLSTMVFHEGTRVSLLGGLPTLYVHDGDNVEPGACSGCRVLSSLVIGKATSVGTGAFVGCINLTQLVIHEDVRIGNNAFLGCNNLKIIITDNSIIAQDKAAYGMSDGVKIINSDKLKELIGITVVELRELTPGNLQELLCYIEKLVCSSIISDPKHILKRGWIRECDQILKSSATKAITAQDLIRHHDRALKQMSIIKEIKGRTRDSSQHDTIMKKNR